MPRKLTKNESDILVYLKGKDYISPTQIGHDVGGKIPNPFRISGFENEYRHSAWASPICKRLTNMGLLQRNESGWYRNPER